MISVMPEFLGRGGLYNRLGTPNPVKIKLLEPSNLCFSRKNEVRGQMGYFDLQSSENVAQAQSSTVLPFFPKQLLAVRVLAAVKAV